MMQATAILPATEIPLIKTPNLDKLHDESARFREFHVSPTCSPDARRIDDRAVQQCDRRVAHHPRAKHPERGQCHLSRVLPVIRLPYRDLRQMAPGGQLPLPSPTTGVLMMLLSAGEVGCGRLPITSATTTPTIPICTTENFKSTRASAPMSSSISPWISCATHKRKQRPFFCYLATTAAHVPYWSMEKDSAPYEGVTGLASPGFYGMIANIDENVGRLRKFLAENGLAENTILIVSSDNGTAEGGERLQRLHAWRQGLSLRRRPP